MSYAVRVAGLLLGYATYFGSNFLFITSATPLLLLLTPFPRVQFRLLHFSVHRYLAFFTRWWLPIIGVYTLTEAGKPKVTGPCVYVANHRSFMDAPLILGLLERTGVMVKTRYTNKMLPGLLARYFEFVSLDPNSPASVLAGVERCRAVLARGSNLLVFPEGTRARSGRLGRFKNMAFRIALDADVPVVPVITHSTVPFMAKLPGSVFPRPRNFFRIRFLDPEMPLPNDAPDALADRVYRRMARTLKELDQGTVWETVNGQARTV
jgi:1-acyl-sn-glycerol-3-phosphate acyltransferase